MKNKFLEKALTRIKPEERALMVKSLEIISQIHEILERKKISQKVLAENLNVSPAAVSKMLSPGGNLELNTIIRLELILGEAIIITPKGNRERERKQEHVTFSVIPIEEFCVNVDYLIGESGLFVSMPLSVN
jgi:transcriptional regulator with XRE-family HTH domain